MPLISRKSTPAKWDHNDLVALSSLGALGCQYVPWSAWSMRPSAVATLVNEIALSGRRSILELGAGTSTIYLARAVAHWGGMVTTVEEDRSWALAISRIIEDEGLQAACSVHHIPVEEMPTGLTLDLDEPPLGAGNENAWPRCWYSLSRLESIAPQMIDMLVVDGPAAGVEATELVRGPAVPLLKQHLAASFTIVLDDIARAGEAEIGALWARELGTPLQIFDRTDLGILRDGTDSIIASF